MGLMDKLNSLPSAPPSGTNVEYELKRSKLFGWRDVVVCLLIVGVFLIFKDKIGGGLEPVLEDTQFGVTDVNGVTHTFVYAEVEDIRIFDDLDAFDKGETVDATETSRVISGTFHNTAYGDYQLHVLPKLHKYIVVQVPGEQVLVFNLESDDTTQILYDNFVQWIAEQKQ